MTAIHIVPTATRLSDEVAGSLERWIREQGLPPGVQLPTEKVLCARFGVSRAVIRQAFARIKAACPRVKGRARP